MRCPADWACCLFELDEDNNAAGECQSVEDEGIERDSDEIMDEGHHHHHSSECVAQQPEAAALPLVSANNDSNNAILSLNQVMDVSASFFFISFFSFSISTLNDVLLSWKKLRKIAKNI